MRWLKWITDANLTFSVKTPTLWTVRSPIYIDDEFNNWRPIARRNLSSTHLSIPDLRSKITCVVTNWKIWTKTCPVMSWKSAFLAELHSTKPSTKRSIFSCGDHDLSNMHFHYLNIRFDLPNKDIFLSPTLVLSQAFRANEQFRLAPTMPIYICNEKLEVDHSRQKS